MSHEMWPKKRTDPPQCSEAAKTVQFKGQMQRQPAEVTWHWIRGIDWLL